MGAQIEALGVPVITLGMRAGRPSIASMLKLRREINALQPDLIQGWMYHGNLVAILARFFCAKKVPVVWNIRQSLYQIEKEKVLTRQVIRANRFLSKSVCSLLYNSHLSREQHEAFGFSSCNGLVIPNGINCQQFHFSIDARRRIRSELSIPEKVIVVGHVARFHPMKDHACFLKAAAIILEHYPETHFILSGREVSLNNVELERHIPNKFKNRFHLLGERSDMADLMSAMDILSSSSWGEAFPNVLGEAMAVGIPCVTTDVGDSALIIGNCGIVVPPKDEITLANGMELLLAMPSLERRALGDKSRQRIEDNFKLSVIVEKYAELYKWLGKKYVEEISIK
jgi:glycosyltransferase involved in cell wall biosynthesis